MRASVPLTHYLALTAGFSTLNKLSLVMLSRRPDGRWEAARACPTIVPVLSLGRRVLASEGAGSLAGTFLLSAPAVAAGGPQLRDLNLSSELLKALLLLAFEGPG